MAKFKIYIQSNLVPTETEVTPVFTGKFSYKSENERVYYKYEIKDKLHFNAKADYDLIKLHEANECEEIFIRIEQLVTFPNQYLEIYKGVFTYFQCTPNASSCWIDVKPKTDDIYKCVEDGLKEDVNIFTSGNVTKVYGLLGSLESQTCNVAFATWDENQGTPPPFVGLTPLTSCLSDPTAWCVVSDDVEIINEGYPNGVYTIDYRQTTVWHREVITTDCVAGVPAPPPSGSWTLLTDDCGGSNTSTFWRCPLSGSVVVGDYDRGRLFSNVIQTIVTSFGCDLQVKSDFFNINPLGDAPSNIAYDYAVNYLHNMTVHQKSDIKDKNTNTPSTSAAWELKADDFFSDLRRIFNVYWDANDTTLILEHYSFFTSEIGADATNVVPQVKQYDHTGNNNTKTQKYYWADKFSSYGFRANPITYDCGEEEKEVQCVLISTDLQYIENSNNVERVNDEGFVLVSNFLDGSRLVIDDANDSLKWSNLHQNLHKHGRLFKSGKINNTPQEFLSFIPYRKQVKFSMPFCSSESFDPTKLITTYLGDGRVGSADIDRNKGKVELELIH